MKCYIRLMRTTLDIDEDVLQAARELSAMHKTTMGKMLSELARRGLEPRDGQITVRTGVPVLPPQPGIGPVGLKTVNRLRDEE